MSVDRLQRFLQQHDPTLKPIQFEQQTPTAHQAAEVLGVEIGQIAKSILFRSGSQYGLFVTAGDVRTHFKKVKQLLGGKNATTASAEEVERFTGYPVGAVCPFPLQEDIPVYLDQSLQRFDIVYTGGGTDRSLLPISFNQLVEMTGGTVIDPATVE